jgi:hypothetical protein
MRLTFWLELSAESFLRIFGKPRTFLFPAAQRFADFGISGSRELVSAFRLLFRVPK